MYNKILNDAKPPGYLTTLSLLNRKCKRTDATNLNIQKSWSRLAFYWKTEYSSGLQRLIDLYPKAENLDTVHCNLIGAWEYSSKKENDKDY